MQQVINTPTQTPDGTTGPPTSQQDFGKTRKHESWKSAISTILILIAAPIVALSLTAYVFQSYEVDGPSMENTLQNHDRLIVWKWPRTVSRISNKPFIPERGDIVIFVLHGIEQFDPTHSKQLIKRVIALPGERIVIRNNVIKVYNKEHPKGFNPDKSGTYTIVPSSEQNYIDMVIPKDKIFVAGDNRPNSLDSRIFGPVNAQDIIGTLAYRIFPINKVKSF